MGRTYIKLYVELKNQKKGLIFIKNNDHNCFLWCHVTHINNVKTHSERITKNDKKLANDLDYDKGGFHVWGKEFNMIEKKSNICIKVFCYETKLVFPIYISNQKFKNSKDLLIVIDQNKSHYVYIKDFNRFMFQKLKNKNKKYFYKSC